MGPGGHVPEWPDKAMFSAMLLMLAGGVGAIWRLALPSISVAQDDLPVLFTQDIPGYELTLCLLTLVLGIVCLLRQAAWAAYLGALTAIASLGMYGLVPFFGLLATAAMVKSHLEGEETHDDGFELHGSLWPDKAMAASLLMVVVAGIAVLQGILLLAGRFEPILLSSGRVAGSIGVLVGLLGFVAAREVYRLRNPWLGWCALAFALATLGFYLIGPVLALIGMVLLGLAHREDEFIIHTPQARAEAARRAAAQGTALKPKPRRRRPVKATT